MHICKLWSARVAILNHARGAAFGSVLHQWVIRLFVGLLLRGLWFRRALRRCDRGNILPATRVCRGVLRPSSRHLNGEVKFGRLLTTTVHPLMRIYHLLFCRIALLLLQGFWWNGVHSGACWHLIASKLCLWLCRLWGCCSLPSAFIHSLDVFTNRWRLLGLVWGLAPILWHHLWI